jgi:uncharacterized protein YheU (UPF0270 family)
MARFVPVPPARLEDDVLRGLLEAFIGRDGTDYGERELAQEEKVGRLRRQLDDGDLLILYDLDSEQWDLVPRAQAEELLHS